MMSVEEVKDLILFAKEQGAKSFTFDKVSIEFFEAPRPARVVAPVEDGPKSTKEQAEDLDELLFASAGY